MLADPCADPGIFARVVQVFFFGPQLLQFYSGFSMVYFKENYNFTRFRGGGGGGGGGGGVQPILGGGGVQPILGGGGGWLEVQMLILETHRTFDFPGGGADPISPLDPHM